MGSLHCCWQRSVHPGVQLSVFTLLLWEALAELNSSCTKKSVQLFLELYVLHYTLRSMHCNTRAHNICCTLLSP